MSSSTASTHVTNFRSRVDNQELPCVVTAIGGANPPMLVLLHDLLVDPSPSGFVEDALRIAHRWVSALGDGGPLLIVQPYGRGNAGFIGVATRDLFEAWSLVAERSMTGHRKAMLVGIGAGGTGALRLAALFPDRFSAVAAVAPSSDHVDVPFRSAEFPPWERSARRAYALDRLAFNLRAIPVRIEHPWWFLGFDGHAAPRQSRMVGEVLRQQRVAVESVESTVPIGANRLAPEDPADLVRWLRQFPTDRTPSHIRFATGHLRSSTSHWLRIGRLASPTRIGRVDARVRRGTVAVQTRGVTSLALAGALPGNTNDLTIDGASIQLPAEPNGDWKAFEKIGDRWHPEESEPPPRSNHPSLDLFWDRLTFVPGTLGDEVDNECMSRIAHYLSQRWRSGAESLNPHVGDRTLFLDCPVRRDVDIKDDELQQTHAIVIGTPRNNLVLARFADRLACTWQLDHQGSGPSGFTIRDRRFHRPDESLVVADAHPLDPQRTMVIVTGNTMESTGELVRKITLGRLPGFLVANPRRVLDWGYLSPTV